MLKATCQVLKAGEEVSVNDILKDAETKTKWKFFPILFFSFDKPWMHSLKTMRRDIYEGR